MNEIKYASIDIGGTNVRFALVKNFKIVKKIRFLTNANNWKETLDKICNLLNKYEINQVALCIPGPANYEDGILLKTPNLKGWNNLNVKKYLLENSKISKIIFENDANAMALANHFYYQQSEKDITQFFTISTGFGAGLILNNKIFKGVNHLGQEIARIPLGTNDLDEFHLSPYAIENFVSGTGINLRVQKWSETNVSTKEIFQIYENHFLYKEIIDQGILSLAKTIATTIGFMAPNLIVFGGSVAVNNSWFIKKAVKLAKKFTDKNQYKQVKFRFDKMKDNSALIGLNYLLINE
ncbi:ROK family protein [Mesomycoplasma lagogenitalium]|uniref:ROK family protein n=1 Tax=Mesomycoplasma lagogenitalium TaxID=171286 RepID=A0ABY8LU95_9BACT|nr:ROK family protein [Mesomycoplasma lagogenitalium]WGI36820.1 ROK family protein [Mesomycoplasma lagogenitalium]